ncbi:MAG: ABC1 kinase family protein [Saprospiraceae bacterium]
MNLTFKTSFSNANRVREIISILLKYGFDEVVSNTALGKLVPYSTLINPPDAQSPTDERIRRAIEELGPTFIKFAQILSNRPDLIPSGLLEEFKKLQSEVPPFKFEQVKNIIEKSTRKPIDRTFKYLAQKPIGAGSIGQVHKGKLLSGEIVAVKIQRPNIRQTIETDISILKYIVRLSEKYIQRQGLLNPMEIIEVFEKVILKEVNYETEARNLALFKKYYESNDRFYVPKIYSKLSNDKMLVQEFIYGCKITDVKTLNSWGIDKKKLAETGLDIYLSQIFEHGFFHADPHPGNIIIQNDGTICLIDFGMVGKLIKADKFHLAGIFIGMAQQDARKMTVSLQQLALDYNIDNFKSLEGDLAELIEEYSTLNLGETNVSALATQLQKIIYKYQLRLPPSIYIILRALTILEGIGKMIYPQLNFYDFLKPYGIKIFKEQYAFKNIRDNSVSIFLQLISIFNNLPFDAKEIISQIKKGKLHIEIKHEGSEELLSKMDFITNRVTLAVISSALFIASSIMMTVKMNSYWMLSKGVSVFSVVGFLLASLLLIVVLVGIIRSGKF